MSEEQQEQKKEQPAITEGDLWKLGEFHKVWRRRNFKLRGKVLEYFVSSGGKFKGAINLEDVRDVVLVQNKKNQKQFEFALVTKSRLWRLATESEEERRSWTTSLTRVVASNSQASPSPISPQRNNLQRRSTRRSRSTTALPSILNSASGELFKMKDTDAKSLPLAMEPPSFLFGQSRQLAVDSQTIETVKLLNKTKDKLSFRFVIPQDITRYKIILDPSEGAITGEGSIQIAANLTPLCTSRVKDVVSLLVWKGGPKALDSSNTVVLHGKIEMAFESLLSTKLDSAEVRLFEKIGEGGFGVVRRGCYRGLSVAVKTLKFVQEVDNVASDFAREVSFLERLRHPHIINFIGTLRTPTQLAIVTEFCSFGNLESAMKSYPFCFNLKLRILQDASRGMDFLHQSNILHRDLKPANILVVSKEPDSPVVAKLTDFGTVRDFASGGLTAQRKETSTSNAKAFGNAALTRGVGTTSYMAPEVLKLQKYEKPADIYSFSMIIYFIITGKDPFSDIDHIASWDIAAYVSAGKRPNLPSSSGSEYDPLIELMKKAWLFEPTQRPNSSQILSFLEKLTSSSSSSSSSVVITASSENRTESHHQTNNTNYSAARIGIEESAEVQISPQ